MPIAPWLAEEAAPRFEQQAGRLLLNGFEVETLLRPGPAIWELTQAVQQRQPNLIVMRDARVRWVRGWLAGDIPPSRVLRRTDCPLLEIPCSYAPGRQPDYGQSTESDLLSHVLFATDFSAATDREFSYLKFLAGCGVERMTLLDMRSSASRGPGSRLDAQAGGDRLGRLRDGLLARSVQHVEVLSDHHLSSINLSALFRQLAPTLLVLVTPGRLLFGVSGKDSLLYRCARTLGVPTMLVRQATTQVIPLK